jgi:hypothetical protein
MANLQLKGKVIYMPGSWGTNVPAANVSVSVIDVDAPSRGDDLIWTGLTDGNGNFQGTSNEWQDTLTTSKWVFDGFKGFPPIPTGHWETSSTLDVSDILALQARIKDGARETALPFVYINDSTSSPPLVLPWGPPLRILGKVNNVDCTTPLQLNRAIKAAADSNTSNITIEIYGPDANLLAPLTQSKQQAEEWVRQQLKLTEEMHRGVIVGSTVSASTLFAVGFIIIAVGVSFLLICCGLGLLYAIHKGYININVEQCVWVPPGAGSCVKINMNK